MKLVMLIGMCVLATGVAVAEEGGFGLGVIAGEPTGLSFKGWLSHSRAIDGAAAWSFSGDDSFQFHSDYLWHRDDWLKAPKAKGRMPVHFGVGGRLKWEHDDDEGRGRGDDDDDDVHVGIRFPFGLSYLPVSAPLDFFVEIAPILDVAPDTDLDLSAALGLRYYFR